MAARLILLACMYHCVFASLPKLNINLANTTVSGLGAGAYFAGQFHIAHSSNVQGAALFGGGPWYCAEGHQLRTQTDCSAFPDFIDVPHLENKANSFAKEGHLDPLDNLGDDRVYLFHGEYDDSYHKTCTKDSNEWYQNFRTTTSVSMNKVPCGHGQPTSDSGVECRKTKVPFINNCQWDGYYYALEFVIPGLKAPTTSNSFNLMSFDQVPYHFKLSSFGQIGYVYVPTACQNMELCTVHIAFHDCNQDLANIGTAYVKDTGLNEIAESNNMVILYPQIQESDVDPINPEACWDWWGYSEDQINPLAAAEKYVWKTGKQISSVNLMLMNLAGQQLL